MNVLQRLGLGWLTEPFIIFYPLGLYAWSLTSVTGSSLALFDNECTKSSDLSKEELVISLILGSISLYYIFTQYYSIGTMFYQSNTSIYFKLFILFSVLFGFPLLLVINVINGEISIEFNTYTFNRYIKIIKNLKTLSFYDISSFIASLSTHFIHYSFETERTYKANKFSHKFQKYWRSANEGDLLKSINVILSNGSVYWKMFQERLASSLTMKDRFGLLFIKSSCQFHFEIFLSIIRILLIIVFISSGPIQYYMSLNKKRTPLSRGTGNKKKRS